MADVPVVNTTSSAADPTGAFATMVAQKPPAPVGSGDSRVTKANAQAAFESSVSPPVSNTQIAVSIPSPMIDENVPPTSVVAASVPSGEPSGGPLASPAKTSSTIVSPVQDVAFPEEAKPGLLSSIAEGTKDTVSDIKDEFQSFSAQFSDMQVFDTYFVPEASIVTFRCPTKKFSAMDEGIVVQGIMAEAFTFSMDSKWDTKAIGGLLEAATRVLTPIDATLQNLFGTSINQPVMARRRWGGTSPLESTIQVKFISRNRVGTLGKTSEKEDVYDNVVKLVQLLLPRERAVFGDNERNSGMLSLFSIPGPTPFGEGMGDALAEWAKDSTFLKGLTTMNGGDTVSITIGNIVSLKSAYITKVAPTFSKALGPTGYPLAAHVVVSFSAVDAPYLKRNVDNEFMAISGNNPLHSQPVDISNISPFPEFVSQLMKDKDSGQLAKDREKSRADFIVNEGGVMVPK